MEKEYESLRQEKIHYENKIITLLGINVTIIIGILGLANFAGKTIESDIIIISLFIYLIFSINITEYFSTSINKIEAYIQVFHENKNTQRHWESINSRFNMKIFNSRKIKLTKLNELLVLVYAILGFISFIFPVMLFKIPHDSIKLLIVVLLLIAMHIYSLRKMHLSQNISTQKDFIEIMHVMKNNI